MTCWSSAVCTAVMPVPDTLAAEWEDCSLPLPLRGPSLPPEAPAPTFTNRG